MVTTAAVVVAVLASCTSGGSSTPADSSAAAASSGTTPESDTDTVTETAIGTATETAIGTATETVTNAAGQRFPDVIDASAVLVGDRWAISATISSPYDSPERYADAWRVVGPDGTVLAVRELAHDHASEQPFTRSLSDVEIPDDVEAVIIEGRDQEFGYGGATIELVLPRE